MAVLYIVCETILVTEMMHEGLRNRIRTAAAMVVYYRTLRAKLSRKQLLADKPLDIWEMDA